MIKRIEKYSDFKIKNLESILKHKSLPMIDPETATKEIEDFIVEKIVSANLNGGVIGLSGGIDSSAVAYLACRAFEKYKIKNCNLHGYILPSSCNQESNMRDAIKIAKFLNIHYEIIDIGEIKKSFIKTIPELVDSKYHLGNLYAEIRAIILSRAAAKNRSLILGTGNKDEDYILGYFTKRGDGQVDISPIGNLSKRMVRELADYLNVPSNIIHKNSTAGLWNNQTDEKELGFSYIETEIVMNLFENGFSKDDIIEITKFGKVRKEKENHIYIVDKILNMHKSNAYKMKMPDIAKVTLI